MRASLDVPEPVTLRARSHGVAGERWLRALPGVIDEVERRWSVVIGDALAKSVVAKMPGAGGPMLARLRDAVRDRVEVELGHAAPGRR